MAALYAKRPHAKLDSSLTSAAPKILVTRSLGKYLKKIATVEGWFWEPSIRNLIALDYFQDLYNITGDIGEIGVYYGKSAILLAHLVRPEKGERLLLNDTFPEPNQPEIFLKNWQRFAPRNIKPLIIERDSRTLTKRDTGTNCRIFHVDGNHDLKTTIHDLETALKAIRPDGVVAVDDVFSINVPEVSRGFFVFMTKYYRQLAPFLLDIRKVYLAPRRVLPLYYQMMERDDVRSFLGSWRKPNQYSIHQENFWGTRVFIVR